MHIIGAGGHAKVVADIIEATKNEIEGVWDDNATGELAFGRSIKGDLRMFSEKSIDRFIIAIGNNKIRKNIAMALIPTTVKAIHPSAIVSQSVEIGNGTVLMANVVVNAAAVIGQHVIINTSASVDHDCKIGDYVHLSPKVALAGNVEIGEGTHVGIGASIIQQITIGKWAVVGAGAVVIKDVPDYAVVVGNPAKIIKYNHE